MYNKHPLLVVNVQCIVFLGFNEGFLFWDDEDSGNANERGGTLPDGDYTSNTKVYYCCR